MLAAAIDGSAANRLRSQSAVTAAVAIEHPVDEAERPHVLAAQPVVLGDGERLHRLERQPGDIDLDGAIAGERTIGERIGRVTGLAQVALVERAGIDDDDAAVLQLTELDLERRRVESDQHIRRIARGLDLARAEIDLEGGNAIRGADRRANFRRKIREGGEIVAGDRGDRGETVAGELNTIARITGEADDDGLQRLAGGYAQLA